MYIIYVLELYTYFFKFFPVGTLFACRYLYILDANKVVIN